MAGGRPTKYKPEHIKVAQAMAKLGATDPEVAQALGVALSTLNLWKVQHPAFSEAMKVSKSVANQKVVESLWKRAMGYSVTETDIRVIDGKIVQTPIIRHYPPDPTCMIFFLKNRDRQNWSDRRELDPAEIELKKIQLEREKFLLEKLIAGETDTETEDDKSEFFAELAKRLPN